MTYYQLNQDNKIQVLYVDELSEEIISSTHYGFIDDNNVISVSSENGVMYYHVIIGENDIVTKDTANKAPITVNGTVYQLDKNGEVFIANLMPLPQPSIEDIAHMMSLILANQQISGAAHVSVQSWHDNYIENICTLEPLDNLVGAELLSQKDVNKWVKERKELYGE
jgi:hypothetical protein